MDELHKLLQDRKDFPINYNHYYTDTVHKKRQDRIKAQIQQHVPSDFHAAEKRCSAGDHYPLINANHELNKIIRHWADDVTPNMEEFSCEEALDCLLAIYKVSTHLRRFNFFFFNSQSQFLTIGRNIGTAEDVYCQRRDAGH